MILKRAKQSLMALSLVAILGISGLAVVNRLQGNKMLSVQTNSMVPSLERGDLVSVKSVPESDLRVGDVITFISPIDNKSTITHRLIATPTDSSDEFQTQGDANQVADEPIEARQIVGKMDYAIPYVGFFADLIRQPLGLALIIYLPAFMIVIAELKRLALYFKSQEKYTVTWRRKGHSTIPTAKLLPILMLIPLFLVIPTARAAFGTSAVLTDNTISMRRPPQPNICNTSGNNTSVTVTGTGNVNITNSNNQNAQSGNASSTNGGNATSGSVTNCNSTNINVTVR